MNGYVMKKKRERAEKEEFHPWRITCDMRFRRARPSENWSASLYSCRAPILFMTDSKWA
jgi:hypothetical protein